MKNTWRTATILLGIFCLGLIMFNQFYSPTYDFGNDFEIKKDLIHSFSEMNNYQPFKICKIKTGECILLSPLK